MLPYGTAATVESSASHDFTTYEREPNSNLDYAVNRFYDCGTARFLQPDPLGPAAFNLSDPQTLNGYAYCDGDPINRIDPLGLREILVYDYSERIGNTIYDYYHVEDIWDKEGREAGDHVPGRGGASGGTKAASPIPRGSLYEGGIAASLGGLSAIYVVVTATTIAFPPAALLVFMGGLVTGFGLSSIWVAATREDD